MRAALELFEQLEIKYVPPNQAGRRGPHSTCCGNFIERLIRTRGIEHATIVLRTIIESEGNEGELIADVIGAVSDLVRTHPRWVGLGLAFIEAFDKISLAQVRKTAKATGVQPLRDAIMTLLCVELEKIVGPSKLPKAPRPLRTKAEPKPPRSLTRVPGVEKNIALGVKLLALRAEIKHNASFGHRVRRQFDIDAKHCAELMRAARAFGARPDIYTRLSWRALLVLASSMPPSVRQSLEARILAGESVGAPEIRRARGASCRSKRPADQSARIAA